VADIEDCKDCHIRYFCGGSCRAAAYRCGGSLFVPDVLDCEYYKILADRILENGDEITKKALQELLESTNRM
jgi:sulfatase maturation enzyme AslB (radical SAM superfamily)